jgi:hypothetical protein
MSATGRSRRGAKSDHRSLIAEFAFELIIVFVGVTAAFALENFRQARQDASYRQAMLGGLRESLGDFTTHGAEIDRHLAAMLRDFDAATKRGEMPPLPAYREGAGERPPTRAWDGIVATGATRSLDPALFFRLARFYGRADSFGDRYLRYNAFTEERVLPYLVDKRTFYESSGHLKPEYAAYVDRLRDLQREDHAMVVEAAEIQKSLPH